MKLHEMIPEVAVQRGIEALRGRLLHALEGNLLKVVFFGSRRRGRFSPESDVDLLVVVERKTPELTDRVFSIAEEVEERFFLQGFSFSIHLYDLKTYQGLKASGSLFIKVIDQEGEVVYERKVDS